MLSPDAPGNALVGQAQPIAACPWAQLSVSFNEVLMVPSRATAGLLLAALATLLAFSLLSFAGANQAKDDPAAADKEKIDTTATPRPSAAGVKFRKELGLNDPALSTLGARIDAARRAHDPVALGRLTNELAAAEKASGKTASVTSKELAKQAAELAKMRRKESELQALIASQQQITGADDTIAILQQTLSDAKAAAKADSEAIRMNQEPTWQARKIIVNNYTSQYIDVWVNGSYKVQVSPGMSQSFLIEHRWNPVVLEGYGNDDESGYGPVNLWGRFKTYTWNIN
jgi:hypothetical protein